MIQIGNRLAFTYLLVDRCFLFSIPRESHSTKKKTKQKNYTSKFFKKIFFCRGESKSAQCVFIVCSELAKMLGTVSKPHLTLRFCHFWIFGQFPSCFVFQIIFVVFNTIRTLVVKYKMPSELKFGCQCKTDMVVKLLPSSSNDRISAHINSVSKGKS